MCQDAHILAFQGKKWILETDVRGFASPLFEIVVGSPAKDEAVISADVPKSVSKMIKSGLSDKSRRLPSFWDIFEILKQNNFEIMAGIDLAEVLGFINWVEFLEISREWQQLHPIIYITNEMGGSIIESSFILICWRAVEWNQCRQSNFFHRCLPFPSQNQHCIIPAF
jgi:hypothetical protein